MFRLTSTMIWQNRPLLQINPPFILLQSNKDQRLRLVAFLGNRLIVLSITIMPLMKIPGREHRCLYPCLCSEEHIHVSMPGHAME